MTVLKSAKVAIAAAVAAGSLGMAGAASANVVCNGVECWHVHNRFDYPTGVGVTIHDNAWGYRHHNGYQWRHDRFDRGYYRNGVWISF
ncbi:MAG TPA: hypothetical protein VGL58_17320 [Caulobacteraceae bacterium]|jgi:hypothetical protein